MCANVNATDPTKLTYGFDLLKSKIPSLIGKPLNVYVAAPASTLEWLLKKLKLNSEKLAIFHLLLCNLLSLLSFY